MVVIEFPKRRHARASAGGGSAASTSNVMSDLRLRLASLTKSDHRPGGIPRRRQVLTVESSTCSNAASADVPPSSSMIVSSVMAADTSWQIANRQGLADCQLTQGLPDGEIQPMGQQGRAIGDRIRRTREALDLNGPQFAAVVGTDKSTLSNIEKGVRNFTLPMAIKLKRKKGIPLDWIYCADPARLPRDVSEKIEMTEVA